MKIYTQAEFDAIERDERGTKVCPTGDYSAIKTFGEWCSFGERCSFGAECSFGEWCSFGAECSFGKGCSFGEWCRFGERCKATSPYWGYMYEPPFETKGRILPPRSCRAYWEERTGLKLSGCYNDIAREVDVKKLLRSRKWTSCERRILKSWV